MYYTQEWFAGYCLLNLYYPFLCTYLYIVINIEELPCGNVNKFIITTVFTRLSPSFDFCMGRLGSTMAKNNACEWPQNTSPVNSYASSIDQSQRAYYLKEVHYKK